MNTRFFATVPMVALATATIVAMPDGGSTQASGLTEGHTALEVPLRVTNRSAYRLTCNAGLAHWHAFTFARLAPGESATLDLRFLPADRTYVLLNDASLSMPVETLWCGIEGRAYVTRSLLPLPERPKEEAPRVISCHAVWREVRCGNGT